ncbi:MAG: twin-arginine translocase subunit TatC [Chitinophagaceae bacterium]|nr:twin-arginine translocase subunit TatC [Chitinophagaceae bacterium]
MAGFFNKIKGNGGTSEMTFIDHLEALRAHIVRSIIAILLIAIIIFIFRDWVFDNIITGPINPDFISYKALCNFSHWLGLGDVLCMPPVKVEMQTTTFGGQFISSITIAFVGGFIVAFPYIFWEFWRFIKPALQEKEIKNTRFAIFWVSFFFFTGAAFGFFLLGPFTFNFLAGFQLGTPHVLVTRPTLNDYIDNLVNILLGCGIAFELPVLSYVLTKIGIITPSFLKKTRKYAVVLILLAAAVITPSPDWMSQMLVFIPLWMLYEISIIISAKVFKEDMKKELEEWS